ncbi:MAG: DUF1858 domain-containing protein [Candidatus Omnitrophica bacterium]|nr:DUF1858 domain-containing protein [Candidatus Omnitrophota bacterium]
MKEIDINKTVYELTQQYPELIDILSELGFLGIKNPVLRNTLGRATTLKQGCEKQGENITEIIKKLQEKGYTVKGE